MDKFESINAGLLGHYWRQVQSHEQAGSVLTAIAVVALSYVLYTVSFGKHLNMP